LQVLLAPRTTYRHQSDAYRVIYLMIARVAESPSGCVIPEVCGRVV